MAYVVFFVDSHIYMEDAGNKAAAGLLPQGLQT